MVFKKMLFMVVMIIAINAILISPIYAIGEVISSGEDFLQKGYLVEEVIDTTELRVTSNFIYNMFWVVAIVLAVGVGTVLGIKFMVSSVEGQAKIKEAIVPYMVGCIVIFAAFPIWSFLVDSGKGATGITGTEGTTIETEETQKKPIDYYCTCCGKKTFTSDEHHNKKCNDCYDDGKINIDYCWDCGKKIFTSDEKHNKKCEDCSNK